MDQLVFLTENEYDDLVKDREFLGCLEQAGVDNWEGYSIACQLFEGEIDEDDI